VWYWHPWTGDSVVTSAGHGKTQYLHDRTPSPRRTTMIGFVRAHWRLLNIAIKLALVMAFGSFVAKRFAGHEDIAGLWEAFLNNLTSGPSMLLLLTACALMPFNWLTETLKWTTLLKPVTLPWRRALAGILSGVTLSLFTPNRIGEYGGRILYVPPADRWR